MRIGIDATWARVVGSGTASYTQGLVRALVAHDEHQFVLYFGQDDTATNELFAIEQPNVERRCVDGHGQVGRTFISLTRACAADTLDVFHSPGYFLPLWHGAKIVTLHDVNMFAQWDKWWRPGLRLRWLSLCAQTLLSSRTAATIVTDSHYSAQAIARVLRLPAVRTTVVYPGVDDRYFDPSHAVPTRRDNLEEYLLYVSVLSPLKNLHGALRAFAQVDDSHLSFVIVGREDGTYYESIIAPLIDRLGIQDRVHRLGVVSLEELVTIYHGARALVYPSFAEGFGLPPLEAMACGTPVVASNTTSMPEVLGDAVLLVDPTDIGALAEALHHICTDDALRTDLIARGQAQAAKFRWQHAARAMLELYARA